MSEPRYLYADIEVGTVVVDNFKKYIARRLGIEERRFEIGDVEYDYDWMSGEHVEGSTTIKVRIDSRQYEFPTEMERQCYDGGHVESAMKGKCIKCGEFYE